MSSLLNIFQRQIIDPLIESKNSNKLNRLNHNGKVDEGNITKILQEILGDVK